MKYLLGKYENANYFNHKYTKMLLNADTDMVKNRRINNRDKSMTSITNDRIKSSQYIALAGLAGANNNPIRQI